MLDNASILITGGTGSFGQRCVATILERYAPRRLIVFSRDELKQFEMSGRFNSPCMRYFIGDIRDEKRLLRAFDGVDYVIHAAALKQVPALEYNPGEAIKTNILGSENIVNAALEMGVKKLIALSTDKAALPVNLYGATKLVADKLFISGNSIRGRHRTDFTVVRYGNVVGSRGSVVPYFKKLVADGATTLPITHLDMTRFLITLQQGVDFVLKAFEVMRGGEILVPKLPSVKIVDVAKLLGPNLKHEVVGIRPGEKIHEVLCPGDDSNRTLEFKNFYLIQPQYLFAQQPSYEINPVGDKGKLVPAGFEYRSNTNSDFLSEKQLRELISGSP